MKRFDIYNKIVWIIYSAGCLALKHEVNKENYGLK